MSIPVMAVVIAAYRDAGRFIGNQPILIALAALLTVPFAYQLVLDDLTRTLDPSSASDLTVRTVLLSCISSAIWLPVLIIAVRQSFSGTRQTVRPGDLLSVNSARYILYGTALGGVMLLVTLAPRESTLAWASVAVFVPLYIVVIIRTTLAFTALALDRSTVGFLRSYRMTSGHSWRILAVFLLTLASSALPWVAAMVWLGLAGSDLSQPDHTIVWPAVGASLGTSLAGIVSPIAGAHIFRWIEGRGRL